ncbi:MAG: hypothetical protein KAJ86_06695 [Alphaproteobacteria bacterium]|nr:hypothetical protein [Alphaproteobacteria bacterium]
MVRSLYLLCLSFIIFIVPPSAQAYDKNDKNAAHLKTIFDNLIHSKKIIHTGITFDGEVIVEPTDTYYAITLPYMKIKHPDGSQEDIGMISINATPHEKKGQWKMAIAIPTPIILFNKKGEQIMHLDIGDQSSAGIWHEKLQNFIKLNTKLKNIKIENIYPSSNIQVPLLEILYNFEEDKNQLWSGTAITTLHNIESNITKGHIQTTIDEIKAIATLDKYDTNKKITLKENILENNAPSSKSHNTLFKNFFSNANGGSVQYSVSGIKHTYNNEQETIITLDHGQFNLDINGVRDDKITLGTNLNLKNFNVTPKPIEYKDITPSNLNLGITIHDIPLTQIITLIVNATMKTIEQSETPKLSWLSFFINIPVLLSQSNTYVEIKDNYISGHAYKATLNGNVQTDITAVNSATANLKTTLHGLDHILAKTQVLAANPNSENVTTFRSINAILEKIKALSKVETTKDNTFIHVLNIIMNKQGQILLNGKDLFTGKNHQTDKTNQPVQISHPENIGNNSIQTQ